MIWRAGFRPCCVVAFPHEYENVPEPPWGAYDSEERAHGGFGPREGVVMAHTAAEIQSLQDINWLCADSEIGVMVGEPVPTHIPPSWYWGDGAEVDADWVELDMLGFHLRGGVQPVAGDLKEAVTSLYLLSDELEQNQCRRVKYVKSRNAFKFVGDTYEMVIPEDEE